ncbi:MAG TPA: hypothetical protein VKR31_11865 [Rhizomicrobium sp.]|nr:hypothetical protein [Rhizomicrobium sp.]
MAIEIRETKIITDDVGTIVEMLISDDPAAGKAPNFSVVLRVRPELPNPAMKTILATFQTFALQAVQKQLSQIVTALRKPIEK